MLAEDDRSGREIGGGDDLDQLLVGDRRIVDIGFAGEDDLAEIVRRDVGRHADRDAAGAVDQQIGEARRKDLRLGPRPVIIGGEIDRVLVEIVEKGHRHLGEPRLGVAHRGGRIRIDRAEIALAVDQGDPHRPVLGHPGERVVDRAVAVRVIIAHHVADDLGRFAIGAAGHHAAFLAGVEDSPVDRLQTVADVGQRPRHDHAHRVIEIGGLHLVDDLDRRDVAGFDGRRFAGQCLFLIGFERWCRAAGGRGATLADAIAERHPARTCARARGGLGKSPSFQIYSLKAPVQRRFIAATLESGAHKGL